MKKFMSANQRIKRDLFLHHLGVLLAPLFFYFKQGFDAQELVFTMCVPAVPFLILGWFLFSKKKLTPPHCTTPKYTCMRIYFWIMVACISLKGLAPNILNFPWMLFLIFTTELFFSVYLLILYWGVGYVASRDNPGAKVRPD